MKSQPPESDVIKAGGSRRATILYGLAALTALVGLADSIYLTIEHIAGRSVRCTIVAGCSAVLSSEYASYSGIPLALIGAVAYFAVFSLATLSAFEYRVTRRLLEFVIVAMLLVTLWLIYLQAFVIKAFCQFCLLSALVTVTLTVFVFLARRHARVV